MDGNIPTAVVAVAAVAHSVNDHRSLIDVDDLDYYLSGTFA
jgi:hypothetical protein